MVIGYLGSPGVFRQRDTSIKYSFVLDDWLQPADLADKIVVVGEDRGDSDDTLQTPFGYQPGLLVHCNIIATLLGPDGPPRVLGAGAVAAIALAMSFALAAFMLRLPLWSGLVMALGLSAAVLATCVLLYRYTHTLGRASTPLVAIGLTYNAVALYEYRRARHAIGILAGRQMVPRALPLFSRLRIGGREETASALFCDVRDFSLMAQHMSPRDLGGVINRFAQALEEVVARHGGVTVLYQGDGTLVLFEPARAGANFAVRAVRAACDLQRRFVELRREWAAENAPELEIGIGIATGRMLVGVLGGSRRMQFSALGDAVNVAARIQGFSRECGYGVLITQPTRDLVAGEFDVTPCGPRVVKGHDEPVEVFGVRMADAGCEAEGRA
jgi:adenylate cyclase